jgi:hypothetical protein
MNNIHPATVADLLDEATRTRHEIGLLPGDDYWLATPGDLAAGASVNWVRVDSVRQVGGLVDFNVAGVGFGEHPGAAIVLRAATS